MQHPKRYHPPSSVAGDPSVQSVTSARFKNIVTDDQN